MTILLAVVDLIILGSLIYFLQVEIHFLCVYLCMYTCVYWITSKKIPAAISGVIKRPDIDRPIDQLDLVRNKKLVS